MVIRSAWLGLKPAWLNLRPACLAGPQAGLPAWQGLRQACLPAWQGLRQAYLPAWQGLRQACLPAWQGLRQACLPAWQGIRPACVCLLGRASGLAGWPFKLCWLALGLTSRPCRGGRQSVRGTNRQDPNHGLIKNDLLIDITIHLVIGNLTTTQASEKSLKKL